MKGRLGVSAIILVVAAVLAALLPVSVRGQPASVFILWFLGFNTTLPPFDNVQARQAVASAVDRGRLAAAGENFPAVGLEPRGCLAHDPTVRQHPYDLQRSKELLGQSAVNLEEAGDVGLWYLSQLRRGASRRELELLIESISAIGLRPTLREFGNYQAFARIATLSVVKLSYWGVAYDSITCARESWVEDLVHSRAELNFFGYRDPEVDAMIDQAKRTGDRQAKARILREVQQKVIDDAVFVPVWWYEFR